MSDLRCPVCDEEMKVRFDSDTCYISVSRCECGVVKFEENLWSEEDIWCDWSIPGISDLVDDSVIQQVREARRVHDTFFNFDRGGWNIWIDEKRHVTIAVFIHELLQNNKTEIS